MNDHPAPSMEDFDEKSFAASKLSQLIGATELLLEVFSSNADLPRNLVILLVAGLAERFTSVSFCGGTWDKL